MRVPRIRHVAWLSAVGLGACGGMASPFSADGPGDSGAGDAWVLPDGGGETGPGEETELAALDDPRSGVFVGDELHLDARLDGERTYVVLSVGEDGSAEARSFPELVGPANLAHVAGPTHARLVVPEAGRPRVEVIDTSDPAGPTLAATGELDLAFDPGWESVFTAADGRLFFCARAEAVDGSLQPSALYSVDLGEPGSPGPAVAARSDTGWACGYPDSPDSGSSHLGSARGAVLASWSSHTFEGWGEDVVVSTLDDRGAQTVGTYFYSPGGVHAYGPVRFVSTDGERVVVDLTSEVEFFLYDLTRLGADGDATFAYARLALPGPTRLLAVVEHVAYLAVPDGVRAYDLQDIDRPELLPYRAAIDLGPDLARPLAGSARRLAIVDAAGRLYLVPRDLSGPVDPTVTVSMTAD